jgi:hypothetical protein
MQLKHLQSHWDDGATQVEVDETVLVVLLASL